jgi:hypothetical protein
MPGIFDGHKFKIGMRFDLKSLGIVNTVGGVMAGIGIFAFLFFALAGKEQEADG